MTNIEKRLEAFVEKAYEQRRVTPGMLEELCDIIRDATTTPDEPPKQRAEIVANQIGQRFMRKDPGVSMADIQWIAETLDAELKAERERCAKVAYHSADPVDASTRISRLT